MGQPKHGRHGGSWQETDMYVRARRRSHHRPPRRLGPSAARHSVPEGGLYAFYYTGRHPLYRPV
ncbi:hypothetical protein ACN6K9_001217 [Streptomyces sp. SAS_267]|uniref:hypothetical protein n=1 Tax=Streptomyces sp. SAS_267 TaxID=3412750 RepID=UPI00403D1849